MPKFDWSKEGPTGASCLGLVAYAKHLLAFATVIGAPR